jgi:hypothetical protein
MALRLCLKYPKYLDIQGSTGRAAQGFPPDTKEGALCFRENQWGFQSEA